MSPSTHPATSAHDPLGPRLKRWRTARGWNQQDLADRAGVARSTLSKIENGLLSPTFEILVKIAQGFGTDLAELLRDPAPSLPGRMEVDRWAEVTPLPDANTRLHPLGAALRGRRFQTMVVEFTTTDLTAFGPWNSHATQDMLFVLSGRLVLHTEGYAPRTLGPGESVHFDGAMPHACLAEPPGPCRCLYVFAPA